MRAYGELLANVAKTVDDFARDNITENNARDWLAGRFPDVLAIGEEPMSGGFAEGDTEPAATPRVQLANDEAAAQLPRVSQELGVARPVTDISDPNEELRLVTAARLQIARMRQQLLASMVILGINRIVVTDGLIHAKVIFDVRASDQAKRVARASMADQDRSAVTTSANFSYGAWFSPIDASVSATTSNEHVATVQSSVEDTSESKAAVKAQLSGEVRVNFKSD
jgi:hypothetical protein